MMKRAFVLLLAALLLSGCDFVRNTHRSLTASKGFLEQAKVNHPECNPILPGDDPLIVRYGPQSENRICQAMYRAISFHHDAWLLLGEYCSYTPGWDAGATCRPPADEALRGVLQSRIKAKLRELDFAKAEVSP